MITTIVTPELGSLIAKKHGIKVLNTLTGFSLSVNRLNYLEKMNISISDMKNRLVIFSLPK